MSTGDVVFRSRRVVTPDGETPLCVVVRDGSVVALEPWPEVREGAVCIDVAEHALLPGFVDTHVHLNEPGRTDWEGFETGTRAAAAGGITTLVDMPLNSVPAVTTVAALEAKRAAARQRCHVDVGFWGGIVPGNEADIIPLREAGVLGFKCFLAPSGVPEFEHVDVPHLVHVLPLLAACGAPLLVHAEDPAFLMDVPPAGSGGGAPDPRSGAGGAASAYASWLASRPDAAEVHAVRALLDLARETRVHIHVVHVASAEVLPLLAAARAEPLHVSAETCPHYLHFAAESIPPGRTEFKCAPPIRWEQTREALWTALGAGVLDLVASDHSPAPPEMKRGGGNFHDAWGGIASLQLSPCVVWTGARRRGYTLRHLVAWMAAAPARLAGLAAKGGIMVGADADFVVFDPDAEWTVEPSQLHHRHGLTPYAGEVLMGRIVSTWLRGECVYDAQRGHGAPRGRLLGAAAVRPVQA